MRIHFVMREEGRDVGEVTGGDEALLRPKLRAIEAVHYRQGTQDMFALRDPSRVSEHELRVSPDVFAIASLFDGQRAMDDILEEFAKRFGVKVLPADVEKVIAALDKARFLESPAFDEWRAEIEEEFRKLEVRESVLSGSSYPEDHRDIPKFLDSFFIRKGGPGKIGERAPDATPLRGLVSPHIDIKRGGTSIAYAYKALCETTLPETVVILGVAHAGRGDLFTFTKKVFETPLGRLTTDLELVDRLAAASGEGAYRDEYAHKGEHSVEIQLPWLQHLCGERVPKIVPVLCGSVAECMETGSQPRELEEMKRFTAELGSLLTERAGKLAVIASVDLAHIGRRFGDEVPITSRLLRKNAECDRQMLAFVESGDADGLFEYVRKEKDRRKICGFTAMYVLLVALEAAAGAKPTGRLLHYEQSQDEATESLVSFAAMALE
jgi:AmmeMemoRadiSam system protein B